MTNLDGSGTRTLRRHISLTSLILFSALVFGYLWWGRFQYSYRGFQIFVYVSAMGLVLANHFLHRDSLRSLGFRIDNFLRAAGPYAGLTLPVCFIILLLGLRFGTPETPGSITLLTYLLWAGVQQHVLQNFLRRRSEEVIRGYVTSRLPLSVTTLGIVSASILFALYHLPNPVMVALSLLGALFWCSLFARFPSLPWAIISQTILTMSLLAFFKYSGLGQFEVGQGGYRFQYYGNGTRVAAGHDSEGNPRVVTLPGPDAGRRALIRVFSPGGTRIREWTAFPDLFFSGELSVGDLGYGPGDEIVVAAGPGGGNPPRIRVFDFRGEVLTEFVAGELDNGYGAWVSVACGRILVAPGPAPRAPQEVLQFSGAGQLLESRGFPGLGLSNGVRVSAICGEETTGISRFIAWGTDVAVNPSTVFVIDPEDGKMTSFETIQTTFGAQLTLVGRRNGPPVVAVAPGPLRGYPTLIGIYTLDGEELLRFAPDSDSENHGANLAALDFDADGQDELIVGEGVGPSRPFTVRIIGLDDRRPRAEWQAYP